MSEQPQQQYPFLFTAAEVNLILKGLEELPHKLSAGLIGQILSGAKAIEAKAAEAAENLKKSKAEYADRRDAKAEGPKVEAKPEQPKKSSGPKLAKSLQS
jgi:hypothetical protein